MVALSLERSLNTEIKIKCVYTEEKIDVCQIQKKLLIIGTVYFIF